MDWEVWCAFNNGVANDGTFIEQLVTELIELLIYAYLHRL